LVVSLLEPAIDERGRMVKPDTQPSLLVLILAYEAEETIETVLDRIPTAIHEDFDVEILVLDDASVDETVDAGRRFGSTHPDLQITVLRNRVNQGYGGNQKVGYAYAIAHGLDFVVMVHGDGQYAPEKLPALLAPLRDGRADAVFGSRMLDKGGARRGGMPLYKFVGNRILTVAQNAVLGTDFSEFHSGYRAYSVDALRKVRFRLNTNDFHFDTEIILQFIVAGLRIEEVPIPTYYGDEISRVNGLVYAFNVMRATLRAWLHRTGLLFRRRLQPVTTGNEHYELKLGFASSHSMTLEAIKPSTAVIDIGAGPGGMARHLMAKGCRVAVVDQFEPSDAPIGIEVYVQNLNEKFEFRVTDFDYLLLLDVIEHMANPEDFLERLRDQFDFKPRTLILTTPNVAFFVQRFTLLFGQFNYGESGILDMTHTRLFTFRSLRSLLDDAGFQIRVIRGIPAPFPKVVRNPRLGKALVTLNLLLIRLSKSLFSYQIYVEAEARPDADFIVRDASQLAGLDRS
jgi:glycosyltransferase involved in cell wall biosynthesis